jgi:hypothetical protein
VKCWISNFEQPRVDIDGTQQRACSQSGPVSPLVRGAALQHAFFILGSWSDAVIWRAFFK